MNEVVTDEEAKKFVLEYKHDPQYIYLKLKNNSILRFYADQLSQMHITNSIKRAIESSKLD